MTTSKQNRSLLVAPASSDTSLNLDKERGFKTESQTAYNLLAKKRHMLSEVQFKLFKLDGAKALDVQFAVKDEEKLKSQGLLSISKNITSEPLNHADFVGISKNQLDERSNRLVLVKLSTKILYDENRQNVDQMRKIATWKGTSEIKPEE